jgi:hypothetical protein
VTANSIGSAGLARRITSAFAKGELDLSLRPDAPPVGWSSMLEAVAADRLRLIGASDMEVRRFATFTSALDRARDSDALWRASAQLFEVEPWAFDPEAVARRPASVLQGVLANVTGQPAPHER